MNTIDNDFHPDDKLDNDADQGYWGEQSKGHTYESDRLSDDPNKGNSMLRERAVGQYNAKTYGKKK